MRAREIEAERERQGEIGGSLAMQGVETDEEALIGTHGKLGH